MIDEEFAYQAIALKLAGFNTSVISFETESIYSRPNFAEDEVVVYRGWMMSEHEYDIMLEQIDLMGGKPLTSKEQYYAAHYLPNWLPFVVNMTPATSVFPKDSGIFSGVAEHGLKDLAWRLEDFVKSLTAPAVGPLPEGWKRFQLKDYVKSLKTAGGSVITKPEEIAPALANMEKYRGVIEGGVVVREYEEFVPGSEKRYFIINGQFFGQEEWFDTRVMSMLGRIARDIPSPFFSVDIAYRADKGDYRIVEIGDGQVSDLVGWTNERFVEIWK